MKIAVIGPNIESFGGATQCAIYCIESLNDKNIIPDVFSISGDSKIVNKKHNKQLKYNLKRLKFPKRIVLYSMFIKNFIMYFKDYNYVFDFTNSIPFNKENYFCYIHFPEYIGYKRGKYKGLIWGVYYLPKRFLNIFSKYLLKNLKIDFVCNSKFTSNSVYKTSGRKFPVICPPCNIKEFKNNKKKKEAVVSVGAFTGEKNQLLQIEIAHSFPEIDFEIFGSATRNPKYLRKVINLSKNIKNVHLNPNRPFNEVKEKLIDSLIFLHTSKNEPFGISTVEAISAGCIPIVHNSGGQKEVVPFRELRFNNSREAIKKISEVLKWDDKRIRTYRKKLQKHIKRFDEKVFKIKLIQKLKEK